MAPSLHEYKIVVVDASRAYSLVAYGQPPVHVFFDIEAKQVESRHVPNLLVCQRADDDVFHWWYGDACVQEFLLQLEDWCRGGKQPLTVLAHNFQGYDSYAVIDTLHRLRLKLG